MILLHFPWKSAILHSLLSDSELSGIFFLSTVSSHRKMVFPLVFPLLIFHCLLRDIYTHTYITKISIYTTRLSQRFVSQNAFSVGLYRKKTPHLFPHASCGQVKRLGSHLHASSFGQVVFVLERLLRKARPSLGSVPCKIFI